MGCTTPTTNQMRTTEHRSKPPTTTDSLVLPPALARPPRGAQSDGSLGAGPSSGHAGRVGEPRRGGEVCWPAEHCGSGSVVLGRSSSSQHGGKAQWRLPWPGRGGPARAAQRRRESAHGASGTRGHGELRVSGVVGWWAGGLTGQDGEGATGSPRVLGRRLGISNIISRRSTLARLSPQHKRHGILTGGSPEQPDSTRTDPCPGANAFALEACMRACGTCVRPAQSLSLGVLSARRLEHACGVHLGVRVWGPPSAEFSSVPCWCVSA
jgi:hypothetical protein